MLISEHILDAAREALRSCIAELIIASDPPDGRHSSTAKGAIEAAFEKMRPHIITVAPDTREARENLDFFDALASSPARNAEVIIAFAQKLASVPSGAQVSERPKHEKTPGSKRGRPAIPEELKRKALSAPTGKARAQILYQTSHPTAQQVKSVSTILRHFRRTHQSSGS